MARRILKAWEPRDTCSACGEWAYGSKEGARHAAAALHPDLLTTVVRCPLGAPVWHFTLARPNRRKANRTYQPGPVFTHRQARV